MPPALGRIPHRIYAQLFREVNEALAVLEEAGGAADHAALRELVHLAKDGGPFEGFASGAYREILPAADPFPTQVIWWTSAAKTAKILEHELAYNPNKTIATSTWRVYAVDGTTVLVTSTDTMTYSGIYETHRTRSLS